MKGLFCVYGKDKNREREERDEGKEGENEVDVCWLLKKRSDCLISVWGL